MEKATMSLFSMIILTDISFPRKAFSVSYFLSSFNVWSKDVSSELKCYLIYCTTGRLFDILDDSYILRL